MVLSYKAMVGLDLVGPVAGLQLILVYLVGLRLILGHETVLAPEWLWCWSVWEASHLHHTAEPWRSYLVWSWLDRTNHVWDGNAVRICDCVAL